MAVEYTFDQIVENIKFTISGGITRIEFEEATDNSWELIINRGLNLINRYIPMNRLETLPVIGNGERRGYINMEGKKVTTISEIQPVGDTQDVMWEFYIPENFIRILGGPTDFMFRTNWATLKRIAGTAYTWTENEKKTKIYFDGLPLGCTNVTIRYTADWVLERGNTSMKINDTAADYLIQYGTLYAKYILENVRGRFQGGSNSVSMNTSFDNLTEVKELITKLSDEAFLDTYRVLE